MEFSKERRDFLIKSGKITGGLLLASFLNLGFPKKSFTSDSITLSWVYKDVDGKDYYYRIFFKDNAGSGVMPSEKIYHDEFCSWLYPDKIHSHECQVMFEYPFSDNLVYEFWLRAYDGDNASSSDSNHVSVQYSQRGWESPNTGGGGRDSGGGGRDSGRRSKNYNLEKKFLALNLNNSLDKRCVKSVMVDRFFT